MHNLIIFNELDDNFTNNFIIFEATLVIRHCGGEVNAKN